MDASKYNRRFINAVFWILRIGAPCRDLPPDYGDLKNTHRRFCPWRDKKIGESLLEKLVVDPDFEWLMIDASHIKVHSAEPEQKLATRLWGAQKGAQYEIHLSVDAHGMRLRVIITAGPTADCTQAGRRVRCATPTRRLWIR